MHTSISVSRRWLRTRTGFAITTSALVAALTVGIAALGTAASAAFSFNNGDVVASISSGKVTVYSPTGTLRTTLDDGSGSFTTGSTFDAAGNLYVTDFGAGRISKYDGTGALKGTFGPTGLAAPESLVFDATGNMYVGQSSSPNMLKLGPTGTVLKTIGPAKISRGTDWIDLAADQCTLFYTSESATIMRFNACTNAQGADFATVSGGAAYALRIRPNGEVLVADSSVVVRLDAAGSVVKTYPIAGSGGGIFALNLDPDGTSFWTGDFATGLFWRVDIATGAILKTVNTGTGSAHLFGLSVKGQITAAQPSIGLTPTTATKATGTSMQLTATLQNVPNPNGTVVTFTVTGVNARSGTGTANSSGVATFSYTGSNAGADAVVASASVNGVTLKSNSAAITWTSGTGTPGASLTPPSFDFGNVRTGSISAGKVFTFTSKGTAPLQLTGWSVTGANAADFHVAATTCATAFPHTMATGTSCTVTIKFAPGAVGARHGVLSFSDNASTSPQTAALSGAGIHPHTTLTESSDLAHAGAPFTTTFTYHEHNDGTDPISAVSVAASQCGPLTLVGGDANHNSILDPGETWTYTCTRTFLVPGTYTDHAAAAGTDTVDRKSAPREGASLTVKAFAASAPLSPGYWKNHPLVSGSLLPLNLGNFTVADTTTAAGVFKSMNCAISSLQNAVGCLSAQLLAAEMNVANNASNACIYTTIVSANKFLVGVGYVGPTGTYSLTSGQRATALSLAATLSNFNVGIC